MATALSAIRYFLLDMDGTIYLGNQLLPGARSLIGLLRQQGRQFLFLTNNSARDRKEYQKKLAALGIAAKESEILTSGAATAAYLKEIAPGARLYILGTNALTTEFSRQGFAVVDKTGRPDFVVLGFDTGLTYQKLWDACDLIRAGTGYLATHPDLNCPLEGGRYMPDAGSIIAFIKAATGYCPKIIGKPNREMAAAALSRLNAPKNQTAIVGDRLYTDIAMGIKEGLTSVLLLSGETTAEDLCNADFQPDYVFSSAEELARALTGAPE